MPIGENSLSVTNIPGDMFRIRHDTVKTVLNSFCVTSIIRSECDVYLMFKDLISVHAIEQEEELERQRGTRDYFHISD